MRSEFNRSSGKDNPPSAKALALNLVETCKRSGADPNAIIAALSVVLGTIIANVAESPEVVDIAIQTIHRAIATSTDDDRRGAPLS
jgi:UDP-N-acetylglucosamine enolpyruvyl transferase